MTDDRPQEFFKDLVHDLELREWNRIGHDFEVILDDCPQNTNSCAGGPYFCKGYFTILYIYKFFNSILQGVYELFS